MHDWHLTEKKPIFLRVQITILNCSNVFAVQLAPMLKGRFASAQFVTWNAAALAQLRKNQVLRIYRFFSHQTQEMMWERLSHTQKWFIALPAFEREDRKRAHWKICVENALQSGTFKSLFSTLFQSKKKVCMHVGMSKELSTEQNYIFSSPMHMVKVQEISK